MNERNKTRQSSRPPVDPGGLQQKSRFLRSAVLQLGKQWIPLEFGYKPTMQPASHNLYSTNSVTERLNNRVKHHVALAKIKNSTASSIARPQSNNNPTILILSRPKLAHIAPCTCSTMCNTRPVTNQAAGIVSPKQCTYPLAFPLTCTRHVICLAP